MGLKKKAKSPSEIHDYTVQFFDKIRNAPNPEIAREEWMKICDKKEWVRLDDVVALLDEVTKQIQKKLIRVDKLSNPEEIFTITKRKFCEDFRYFGW